MTIGRSRCYRVLAAAVCVLIGGPLEQAAARGYASAQGGGPAARSDAGSLGYDYLESAPGGSVSHDSNLFQVSGLLTSPQSDTLGTGYIGLCLDDPYSWQRVQPDATATGYRIDRSSCRDFDGFDYRAPLRWRLGPRVSGSLKASRARTLFQDPLSNQRSTRTIENYGIDVDGWIADGWHVLAGLAHFSSTGENSAFQDSSDYQQDNLDAGLKYLSTTGSDIAILWRKIERDQDDRLLNNINVPSTEVYRQDETELRGTWIISAESTLTGRVTYVDRRYDLSPPHDFSGSAGKIGFSWRPTSKIDLRLSAVRAIEPWKSLSSTYRASHNFVIAPTWQATDEISVSAGVRRTYDDFPSAEAGVPNREDKIDHAVLSAKWRPMRNLTINATAFREQRSANVPLVDDSATVGTIDAEFSFF